MIIRTSSFYANCHEPYQPTNKMHLQTTMQWQTHTHAHTHCIRWWRWWCNYSVCLAYSISWRARSLIVGVIDVYRAFQMRKLHSKNGNFNFHQYYNIWRKEIFILLAEWLVCFLLSRRSDIESIKIFFSIKIFNRMLIFVQKLYKNQKKKSWSILDGKSSNWSSRR